MKALCINLKSASTTAVTTLLLLCGAAPLHAGEDKLVYTLTAIEDISYGEQVLAGEYHTAIEGILSSSKVRRAGFEAQTNLCVAYTRSGEFDKAERSCDAALAVLDERRRQSAPTGVAGSYSRRTHEKYVAVALSNRGVLRAVSGRPELARQDFTRATRLKFGLDVADVNLARLGTAEPAKAAEPAALQDS